MPTSMTFKRDTAIKFLEALESNQPIEPPPSGWTNEQLIHLAGVAACKAWVSETVNGLVIEGLTRGSKPQMHTLGAEILAIMIEMAHLAKEIHDTTYDATYHPHVKLLAAGKRSKIVDGKRMFPR